MQYPIANDCLKESIDDHSETKLVTKLLLQVSVSKLHNSIASPPKEGGRKEARDAENNIIISDSTLQSILPPQIKNMSARYTVMFGCECCISAKSFHF